MCACVRACVHACVCVRACVCVCVCVQVHPSNMHKLLTPLRWCGQRCVCLCVCVCACACVLCVAVRQEGGVVFCGALTTLWTPPVTPMTASSVLACLQIATLLLWSPQPLLYIIMWYTCGVYVRCTHGIFGTELAKFTLIHNVYIRSWPTPLLWHRQ